MENADGLRIEAVGTIDGSAIGVPGFIICSNGIERVERTEGFPVGTYDLYLQREIIESQSIIMVVPDTGIQPPVNVQTGMGDDKRLIQIIFNDAAMARVDQAFKILVITLNRVF